MTLLMLYYNIKLLIFNILGVVVYWFLEEYVCIEYLFLQKYKKPSLSQRTFEGTSFDELLGIGITEIC